MKRIAINVPVPVYVVVTEWNRPHDVEGGYSIEGVALSYRRAQQSARETREAYRAMGNVSFNQRGAPGSDDSEWDFDVRIEKRVLS